MGKGSGNIGRSNKVDAVVIPPPTVTGANSGTILNGTTVQLGGGTSSTLLQNTQVDTAALDLFLGDVDFVSNGAFIDIDNANDQILLNVGSGDGLLSLIGPTAGGPLLSFSSSIVNPQDTLFIIDAGNMFFGMGDLDNINNNTHLLIDDNAQQAQFRSSGLMLLLDGSIFEYDMGDVESTNNGTQLQILDNPQTITMTSLGGNFLIVNAANFEFNFGDIDSIQNGTQIQIIDSPQTVSIASAGSNFLIINPAIDIYQIGDIDVSNSGGYLEIDDGSRIIRTTEAGTSNGIFLDFANKYYQIGELAGGVFTNMTLDDSIGKINLNADNGVGVNILPTLSPFAVGGLQPFANNAAAVLAGLAIGDFYRISVAGTSAVAVVE